MRCLHCRQRIAGLMQGNVEEVLEVQWEHDGKTWFGSFYLPEEAVL